MNVKAKSTLIAGFLLTTITNTANANYITQWSYADQAGFENNHTSTTNTATTSDDVAATGNSSGGDVNNLADNSNNILNTNGDTVVDATDNALNTSLTWGTPQMGAGTGPQSSLNIDSPINDVMQTDDFNWAQGTALTHENWVTVGDSLTYASVLNGLALTPIDWVDKGADPAYDATLTDDAPYFAPQLQFGIQFFETANSTTASSCPNGEPNFTGDNINGCGDIFEISGLDSLAITPVIGPDYIEFTVPFVLQNSAGPIPGWNDVEYFVTTRLSGLATLPAGYTCADMKPECFGFVTVEEMSNVLDAQFKIRTIPEPTTLAIFGLGILSIGLSSRRKRNK